MTPVDDHTRPGRVGKVYGMPPQPWDEADTRWYDAGAIRIGVEYRDVDPQALLDTYGDDPAHLAELEARSPEGGFSDRGVSLHVCGADDGHEYLRFDVFDGDPHYHYVLPGAETVNNVVEFDAVAHGDMLPFALDCLRSRLPIMLRHAGGEAVADRLDPAAVGAAVDRVAEVAEAVRAAAPAS